MEGTIGKKEELERKGMWRNADGVRKGIEREKEEEGEEKGRMKCIIRNKGERWRIIGVNGDMERKVEGLRK